MSRTLIATTRFAALEPLGTGGQSAISVASTIRAELLRSLSPEHAALLADPVANPARSEIDWYADVGAPAVPLPEVGAAARAEAEATLTRLGAEITALAARLEESRAEGDRFLGVMLRFALTVPGESSVRVSAGRPVLVGWGHRLAGPRQPNPLIIGRRAGSSQAMPILPPPAAIVEANRPRPSSLLWWLGLAGAVLLWILPFWVWSRATAAPVECLVAPGEQVLVRQLSRAQVTEARLAGRLAALQSAIAARCAHAAPEPAAPGAPG